MKYLSKKRIANFAAGLALAALITTPAFPQIRAQLPPQPPPARPVPQPMRSSGVLRTMPQADIDKTNEVYNDFKNLEGVFPIPDYPETIDMGTFDVATGEFDGLTTEYEHPPFGKPHTFHPTVNLNAALV